MSNPPTFGNLVARMMNVNFIAQRVVLTTFLVLLGVSIVSGQSASEGECARTTHMPKPPHDPEEEKRFVEEINRQTDSPELQPCDEHDIDKMDYATIRRMVYPKKGRWLRFSEEQIQRIAEKEKTEIGTRNNAG